MDEFLLLRIEVGAVQSIKHSKYVINNSKYVINVGIIHIHTYTRINDDNLLSLFDEVWRCPFLIW